MESREAKLLQARLADWKRKKGPSVALAGNVGTSSVGLSKRVRFVAGAVGWVAPSFESVPASPSSGGTPLGKTMRVEGAPAGPFSSMMPGSGYKEHRKSNQENVPPNVRGSRSGSGGKRAVPTSKPVIAHSPIALSVRFENATSPCISESATTADRLLPPASAILPQPPSPREPQVCEECKNSQSTQFRLLQQLEGFQAQVEELNDLNVKRRQELVDAVSEAEQKQQSLRDSLAEAVARAAEQEQLVLRAQAANESALDAVSVSEETSKKRSALLERQLGELQQRVTSLDNELAVQSEEATRKQLSLVAQSAVLSDALERLKCERRDAECSLLLALTEGEKARVECQTLQRRLAEQENAVEGAQRATIELQALQRRLAEQENAVEEAQRATIELQARLQSAELARDSLHYEHMEQQRLQLQTQLLAEKLAAEEFLEAERAKMLALSEGRLEALQQQHAQTLSAAQLRASAAEDAAVRAQAQAQEHVDAQVRVSKIALAAKDNEIVDARREADELKEQLALFRQQELQEVDERSIVSNCLRAQLAELQAKFEQATAELNSLRQTRATEQSEHKSRLREAASHVLALAESQEQCALKLSQEQVMRVDAEERLNSLEAEAQSRVAAQAAEFQERLASLEAEVVARAAAQSAELNKSRASLAEAEAEATELRSQNLELRAEVVLAQTLRSEAQKQLTEAQHQLSETQLKLSETQEQLSEAQHQLSEAQQQLSEAQKQLSETQPKLSETQQQLLEAQQHLSELRAQLERSTAEASKQQSSLEEQSLQSRQAWQHQIDEAAAAAAEAQARQREAAAALATLKKQLRQKEWEATQQVEEHARALACATEAEKARDLLAEAQAETSHAVAAVSELQAQCEAQARALTLAQSQAHALVQANAESHEALRMVSESAFINEQTALAHASDSQATSFLNSVLEQHVAQLEARAAQAVAALQETDRQHAAETLRLETERADYEASANGMMKKMADQMVTIQTMALKKIEALEHELKALRG